MDNSLASAIAALEGKKRVLIATHMNPDGDAIGAASALAHVCKAKGADCRLLFVTGLPDFLLWLPLPCPWMRTVEELHGWTPDLVVAVDCGDAHRTGNLAGFFLSGKPPAQGWGGAATLNIDHHLGNPLFAMHNWADHSRSATGEMIGMLAEHLDIRLKGNLGLAVYLALVSDTGNFSYSNTTAEAFAMASRIVGNGLDVGAFSSLWENNWSLNRMHLWGRLLKEISLHANGAVACSIGPKAYLDELGLRRFDLDGFASWLRKIKGVRVGVFIREDRPDFCKVSLRSIGGDVDVRAVAARFGGGGHAAAAGAEVDMPAQKVAGIIIAELEKVL